MLGRLIVQTTAEGIDLIGIGCVVYGLELARADLKFEVWMIAAVVKDVAGTEKIRVFSWPREAELVDVAFNAEVAGEVKGSIDGEALDEGAGGAPIGETVNSDGWAVGACDGKAATELGNASTRCSGSRLGVRPACQA